jgi:predicted RNA-binding Zn ribbon-like protein
MNAPATLELLSTPWPHRFVAGVVCLDFTNTVDHAGTPREREMLGGYADLLHWSAARGVIGREAALRLHRLAESDRSQASQVVHDAWLLRGTIRRTVDGLRRGVDVGPLVESFSARLAVAGAPALEAETSPGSVRYFLGGARLTEPLHPVLWSLAVFLTSDDAARVTECAADGCNGIFVDRTNSRSRVWCSGAGCGNRARVRRAYESRTDGRA